MAFLNFITIASFAQQETTIVTGKVTGDNSEPLVGVTVKANNNTSKETYTTATNENGIFSFTKLTGRKLLYFYGFLCGLCNL